MDIKLVENPRGKHHTHVLAIIISSLFTVLDDPLFMSIVNASRWPVTRSITNACDRRSLLFKRDANISASRKGLEVLGFLDMCRRNSRMVSPLFVYCKQAVSAESFITMLKWSAKFPVASEVAQKVHQWFLKYVRRPTNDCIL